MGLTIEFYSAEPEELKTLFAQESSLSVDDFVQRQQTFPQADFSFHILPDDLDRLCQILNKYHLLSPARFEDVCAERLWDDGEDTESLTIISEQFARVLAECSQEEIEQVTFEWITCFPAYSNAELLQESPAYQAVRQLQKVAQDALKRKRSLIYHLAGTPEFFEYLRHL